MTKSLALAFAVFAFSAASALASPSDMPNGGSAVGSVPQQNTLQSAESLPPVAAQSAGDSQGFSGYRRNISIPPSVSVPAAPAPVYDSTLGLVNATGGGD
ncbi:MAG TPA: hypothetical protein VG848_03380 [Acetobacteraceae bacterium]|jgi:hypothetical protein|nr:hypothetical protein [Acetobacteraceae bacterium]